MTSGIVFKNGCENFADLIERNGYYVDKTSYLKELFTGLGDDTNPLFIRPRRFGKTLNLSMIKEFCEINYRHPGDKSRQQKLFLDNGRHLAVASDDFSQLRDKFMGEYPVISLSFKGIEGNYYHQAVAQIIFKIAQLYDKFAFLAESSKQASSIKEQFKAVADFCILQQNSLFEPEKLDKAVAICGTFIPQLALMLYKEYGKQVIVIIDEYDVPLQKAVVAKEPYYDDMLQLIKQISINTFKQEPDPWLYKGIISGCLKIAHQSVFTDANNFSVFDMDKEPYTGFFGFTREETSKLLNDCGLEDRRSEIDRWYDGYHFGRRHLYCPWSLLNYCRNVMQDPSLKPEPYWVNTSGNDLISLYTKDSITANNYANIENLQKLMNGEDVEIELDEFTTYPDIKNHLSFDAFMTMMLHTGYVTLSEDPPRGRKVKIRIPNLEIFECFKEKFESIYSADNHEWFNKALRLLELLLNNRTNEAQELINCLLLQFISIRNSSSEFYYHGFLLGLLSMASTARNIECKDEFESGSGYPDLVLKNIRDKTAVILELKKGANTFSGCHDAAVAAVRQIQKKNYAGNLINEGCPTIYGIGIGFGGKNCEIISLGNLSK